MSSFRVNILPLLILHMFAIFVLTYANLFCLTYFQVLTVGFGSKNFSRAKIVRRFIICIQITSWTFYWWIMAIPNLSHVIDLVRYSIMKTYCIWCVLSNTPLRENWKEMTWIKEVWRNIVFSLSYLLIGHLNFSQNLLRVCFLILKTQKRMLYFWLGECRGNEFSEALNNLRFGDFKYLWCLLKWNLQYYFTWYIW